MANFTIYYLVIQWHVYCYENYLTLVSLAMVMIFNNGNANMKFATVFFNLTSTLTYLKTNS